MNPDPEDLQDGDGQRTSARRSAEKGIPPIDELIVRYARIQDPREDLPYGHPEWYDIRHNLWMEAGQYTGSPYRYFPNPRRLLCGERDNELLMNDPTVPPKSKLNLGLHSRRLKKVLLDHRRQSTAAITGASWHQDCHYRLWPALVPVGHSGIIDVTHDVVDESYPHAEGVMEVCAAASVEAGHPRDEHPTLGVGPPPSLRGDGVVGLRRPIGKRKVDALYYGNHLPGIEVTEGSVTIGTDDNTYDVCADCDAPIEAIHTEIAEEGPRSSVHGGRRLCPACDPKWKDRPNNTCVECNPWYRASLSRGGPRPASCTKSVDRRCRCLECHWRKLRGRGEPRPSHCSKVTDGRCRCWDCHWRKLGIQSRNDAPGSSADARKLLLGIREARGHLRNAQAELEKARKAMSDLEPIQVGNAPNIQDEESGISNSLYATEAYLGSTRDYLGSLERKSMSWCVWLAIQQGRYH